MYFKLTKNPWRVWTATPDSDVLQKAAILLLHVVVCKHHREFHSGLRSYSHLSVTQRQELTVLWCLQCRQQRAQETGATSWQWAWQSWTHLTHLSTLVELRTTPVPRTTGESSSRKNLSTQVEVCETLCLALTICLLNLSLYIVKKSTSNL